VVLFAAVFLVSYPLCAQFLEWKFAQPREVIAVVQAVEVAVPQAVSTEPLRTPLFFAPGELESRNACLIRLEDGKELLDLRAEERVPPASLTKMMTLLVTLEKVSEREEQLLISKELLDDLELQDAATAGFKAGDLVAIEDLLYGVILPSGAECCEVLAPYVSGSRQLFIRDMNIKAYELGLEDTNFANTTGLHDDTHFSSARDMAKLLAYALKNDDFRRIMSTETYTTLPTYGHPTGLVLQNRTLQYINISLNPAEAGCKTGFTSQAGLCLATYFRIGDESFVLVTLGASEDSVLGYIGDITAVYYRLKEW
jgi:D-alanyl-D-alanine carboxypeptidase (penicillin-binding protein 5/6)